MIGLLLIGLSLSLPSGIKTVKGLLIDTGVKPLAGQTFLSFDSGRIAYTNDTTPSASVGVYDIGSGSSVTFKTPNATGLMLPPSISGDKVLVAISSDDYAPMTLYVCKLPHSTPIQRCGSWVQIVSGLPSLGTFAIDGSFPSINNDLVVWDNVTGFAYYRISTGIVTSVSAPTFTHGLASNGAIIVFSAKPTSTSSSETIRYYDTTLPAANRTVIDTGLPGYYPSISQNTIAFVDNSTTFDRISYYDIIRNQASPVSTRPQGELSYADYPSIWGNRIVFAVNEVRDNYDCDGDGQKQSGQFCLGLWNIRGPSWIANTISPSAAPAIQGNPTINDNVVAFVGSNGNIQYVTVPMQGDVNQDGQVNNTDKTDVTNCLNQLLKGTIC